MAFGSSQSVEYTGFGNCGYTTPTQEDEEEDFISLWRRKKAETDPEEGRNRYHSIDDVAYTFPTYKINNNSMEVIRRRTFPGSDSELNPSSTYFQESLSVTQMRTLSSRRLNIIKRFFQTLLDVDATTFQADTENKDSSHTQPTTSRASTTHTSYMYADRRTQHVNVPVCGQSENNLDGAGADQYEDFLPKHSSSLRKCDVQYALAGERGKILAEGGDLSMEGHLPAGIAGLVDICDLEKPDVAPRHGERRDGTSMQGTRHAEGSVAEVRAEGRRTSSRKRKWVSRKSWTS